MERFDHKNQLECARVLRQCSGASVCIDIACIHPKANSILIQTQIQTTTTIHRFPDSPILDPLSQKLYIQILVWSLFPSFVVYHISAVICPRALSLSLRRATNSGPRNKLRSKYGHDTEQGASTRFDLADQHVACVGGGDWCAAVVS